MANTYLTRTQGSGNRQIFTQSFWCKVCDTSSTQSLGGAFNDSNNYNYCYLDGGNLKLQWKQSGSVTATLDTNRKFSDTSSFYNIVYAVDTTQATASNRIKLYINGVQETSFSTATYPSLNRYTEVNDNGTTYNIGSASSGQNFNGIMSYVAFVDGTQELPGIFGETDSTTGEWKIKTSITPSVAWGTNGYLILKNGNSVTDQSGNANNFTVGGGTLTNTEDNPSNVFATLNPLDNFYANHTFSNGNNSITTPTSTYSYNTSTLAASAGKFYYEVKVVTLAVDTTIGIAGNTSTGTTYWLGVSGNVYGYSYTQAGSIYNNGSAVATGYATYTAGDIISIAFDLTNNKFYSGKNGTWNNSANPSSGTGGISITAASSTTMGAYSPAVGEWSGDAGAYDTNFGNGFFGTTAISSEGTNASGIGKFEYDVPTGYTALSTKGLNE